MLIGMHLGAKQIKKKLFLIFCFRSLEQCILSISLQSYNFRLKEKNAMTWQKEHIERKAKNCFFIYFASKSCLVKSKSIKTALL